MRIVDPEKRLKQFWGEVDKKHITSIARHIKGKRVLDIGCGNGSTTAVVSDLLPKVHCIGVDDDADEIRKAQSLFPGNDFRVGNAEKLEFEDGAFDTIILRDALHHLFEDADFSLVFDELKRVAAPESTLIVLDPNINFILKIARKIISHKDAECSYEQALKITSDLGYQIKHKTFHTLFSLPLSGGYVGINFVPSWRFLYWIILKTERFFEVIVNAIGLGRFLSFRYLIVGEKRAG